MDFNLFDKPALQGIIKVPSAENETDSGLQASRSVLLRRFAVHDLRTSKNRPDFQSLGNRPAESIPADLRRLPRSEQRSSVRRDFFDFPDRSRRGNPPLLHDLRPEIQRSQIVEAGRQERDAGRDEPPVPEVDGLHFGVAAPGPGDGQDSAAEARRGRLGQKVPRLQAKADDSLVKQAVEPADPGELSRGRQNQQRDHQEAPARADPLLHRGLLPLLPKTSQRSLKRT